MNRAVFRLGLHPLYLGYYDAIRKLLPDEWQPVSGKRSFEDQEHLYAQGRTLPGPIVTKAQPGFSFHNYGLASDWDYFEGGRYTPLKFDDPRWIEYHQVCEKVGVRTLDFEKGHNEYPLKHPIAWIYQAYQQGGWPAVETLLGRREETWTSSAQS